MFALFIFLLYISLFVPDTIDGSTVITTVNSATLLALDIRNQPQLNVHWASPIEVTNGTVMRNEALMISYNYTETIIWYTKLRPFNTLPSRRYEIPISPKPIIFRTGERHRVQRTNFRWDRSTRRVHFSKSQRLHSGFNSCHLVQQTVPTIIHIT
ncbi:hypothetical protein DdX_18634 [Ditylenchus destructor]|uniref:Bulb-type lectin domain-containing protein n=1 Tax=Ditylenchus destructor TaxID=166010 RepID=A0AAD4MKD4_9BILA|nr:hypothetical protein DdX_18634 [Ditylenchus destructor]